ncbi:MAG: chemotaxis protein CheA [Peptococcaceae bacterium]|nr:chemotaxis protein CheA [Peptococcaceae bacterium]
MFSDEELGVFLDELDEKIEVISDGFLQLERAGESPEVVQEIFRAAHTIKGSSAIMGYDKMSALTHEMENLFDRIRQGELRVTSEMIDVLFEALDTLKLLRDKVVGGDADVDIDPIMAKLGKYFRGESDQESGPAESQPLSVSSGGESENEPELTDAEIEIIREALLRGLNAYRIRVILDPDCQMKNVRAFMVFDRLEGMGEVIKSEPPAEQLEEGEFDREFDLVAVSEKTADELRQKILGIAEIEDARVTPVRVSDDEFTSTTSSNAEEEASLAASKTANAAADKKADGPSGMATPKTVRTVRISVDKLDNLMNLVGELVIERTRLDRFAELMESGQKSDELVDTISEISNHLGQVTGNLQDEIMKARMLPINQVFSRFPRMVRDIAHKLGKEINLVIEGRETELDRNIIEIIGEPLLHLVRNAIDHGIETAEERRQLGKPVTGMLKLKAYHEENHIVIIVEDDGRGIDPAKVKQAAIQKGVVDAESAERMSDKDAIDLIFRPGFSTAAEVSDLSGRGVGMDVVRNQIEQINGTVDVKSSPGKGTQFIIKLPLTLAIIRALMVSLANKIYAFPLANVQETIQITCNEIQLVKDREVIVVRGSVLPLVRLAELFGERSEAKDKLSVVIIGTAENMVGVVVDYLIGEQEIVIKSLGKYLGRIPGLSGATILGDGNVALIVDVQALVQEFTRKEDKVSARAG